MVNYMENIINKLKKDTNNQDTIIYRKKKILYKTIYIIYNETLISSTQVSDFVIRSINKIKIPTYNNILNKISNFKDPNAPVKEEMKFFTWEEYKLFREVEDELLYQCAFDILYFCLS